MYSDATLTDTLYPQRNIYESLPEPHSGEIKDYSI